MLISSYTTIYVFLKNFIFSNVYISVNAIFECFYMFFRWKTGFQLSTYAPCRKKGGESGERVILQAVYAAYSGRGVTPHVYVRTYTISFHVFGSIFVLQYLVLLVEI